MRKTVLILVLSTLYLVLSTGHAKAQTFDASKAYSDYQYELSIYEQSHSDYQDAKTFYLANPTLQLQEDARQKTMIMLQDRDQLMVTYLTALRIQILDTTGFTQDQQNVIFGKIDSEVAWYQNHIKNYLKSDALIDLSNKSDESKSRYATNTTPIVDEALFDITLSEEIGIREEHQQIYSDLKNYINTQVAAGKMKIDPFSGWLDETDAVLTTLKTNETTGQTQIQGLYGQNYGLDTTFNNSIQTLTSSLGSLSQLNGYLTDILTTIQNQTQNQ